MDNEDIIRMAQEAGFINLALEPKITRFAALVAAHEREACAKVCEENAKEWSDGNNDWCSGQVTGSSDCAAAIRARSEK